MHDLKASLQKIASKYIWKKSLFIEEKPVRHHLNQVIQVNNGDNEICQNPLNRRL